MRVVYSLFTLVLFLYPLVSFCQTTITGRVQDESGNPIAAASVFLAGTSYGTVADNQGKFSLSGMVAGKYELVVSCVGYKTLTKMVDTRAPEGALLLELKILAEELDNVTIGPGEEVSWDEWGQFFLDNFIGTMPEAKDCFLEDNSNIRIRHYKKQRQLRVTSKKPVVVINKKLGYRLTYQLEYFQYDFDSRIVYFLGYPLFKELKAKNEKQKNQWEANRKDAFLGSQMHFFRSLYRNNVLKEGFEMRKLVKQPNKEKERIKNLMINRTRESGSLSISINRGNGTITSAGNSDSSKYYSQILNQPDEIEILYSQILPGDSIAYQVNLYTAGMDFEDYLHITYIKEKEHPDYLTSQMRSADKPGFQISKIKINEPRGVEINQQGMINDPLLIISSGYWAWSDKVATMLPFDYKLPK